MQNGFTITLAMVFILLGNLCMQAKVRESDSPGPSGVMGFYNSSPSTTPSVPSLSKDSLLLSTTDPRSMTDSNW